MKKLLLLTQLLFVLMSVQADDNVKVKLKTGTTFVGELISIDPLEKIVISIAGKETTISMSDVENVEMIKDSSSATRQGGEKTNTEDVRNNYLGNRKLLVTDTKSYLPKLTITIDNTPHEMILVPGGRMNMGYDGKDSRFMNSDPVHEVSVTSFYISTHPLPASIAMAIVGKKYVDGRGDEPAEVKEFKHVEMIVSSIANRTGYSLRLPTEAEWEFAACSEQQDAIFSIASGDKAAYEWCGDFWGEFERFGNEEVDPRGPSRGDQHVVRAYNARRGKFDRSNEVSGNCYQGLVRLAIKAKDIK